MYLMHTINIWVQKVICNKWSLIMLHVVPFCWMVFSGKHLVSVHIWFLVVFTHWRNKYCNGNKYFTIFYRINCYPEKCFNSNKRFCSHLFCFVRFIFRFSTVTVRKDLLIYFDLSNALDEAGALLLDFWV